MRPADVRPDNVERQFPSESSCVRPVRVQLKLPGCRDSRTVREAGQQLEGRTNRRCEAAEHRRSVEQACARLRVGSADGSGPQERYVNLVLV